MAMTEDQKIRRRAARKADAENEKLREDVGPLFVEQIPTEDFTDANTEYWKARRQWAGVKGEQAGWQHGMERKIDLFIVRAIARRHMTAADFDVCDKAHWFNDKLDFWGDVLTGQRQMTIGWDKISHGYKPVYREEYAVCCEHGCHRCESRILLYVEKIDMRVALTWPRPDWTPPLTSSEFKSLVTIPDPEESESGRELDAVLSRFLKGEA